jgi:hypothetical protein
LANALRFLGLMFGLARAFSLWGGTEPGASCPLMWQKQRAFLPQRSHHAPWVVGPLGFGPEARMGAHSLPGKQACRKRERTSQTPVLENRRWAGSESAGWG